MSSKEVFIIDGTALAYRYYYSMIKNPLTNSKGQNTSAIYGTLQTIDKIQEEKDPDLILVAFDKSKKTFRHELFEDYKATRKKMPDELGAQLPQLKQVVEALGIPLIEKEGLEADDIIGILARRSEEEGYAPILYTGDKDFLQLINDNVKILSPGRKGKEDKLWDLDNVEEKFGVPPDNIPDFMALIGDSSDNIPGVKGIGKKTAQKLFKDFNSLEEIYNNLDKVYSNSVREKLEDQKEQAFLSKKLVELRLDADLDVSIQELEDKEVNKSKLYNLLKDLELHSFLKKFDFDQVEETKEIETQCVYKPANLKEIVNRIREKGAFSFKLEHSDERILKSKIVGIAVSLNGKKGYYFPMAHKKLNMFPSDDELQNLGRQKVVEVFKSIFENESIEKTTHNLKQAKILLDNHNIVLKNCSFDTMLASYLLHPELHKNSLNYIALRYLDYRLKERKDEFEGDYKKLSIEDATNYSAEKAPIIFRLKNKLESKLSETSAPKLFKEIEMPLTQILFYMEKIGINVDCEVFKEISQKLEKKINTLTEKAHELAGEQFNLNSPLQLREILFEKLDLPVIKRGKTGPSTSEDVLKKLEDKHELPSIILEYRTLQKMKSTYVDALPETVNPDTGRIHSSLNQVTTSTGRLSSSDPNLQNIPIRQKWGHEIRKAFIPTSEDYKLLSADYSQVELRILAHISNDPTLRKIFDASRDIHSETAAKVLDKPEDEVTSADRRVAKSVNYGIAYGISAYGLAERLGIKQAKAKDIIDNYFNNFPGVKEYMENIKEEASEKGYVETLKGRRRYLPHINSDNYNKRKFAERTAINTPIQGTSADIIKIAMIDIYDYLKKHELRSEMVLQVHDELLFDVFQEELEEITRVVKNKMEGAIDISVPLIVEIGSGDNWLEAH